MTMVERRREIDPGVFRKVMGSFATGVTVILAEHDGEMRGMTANAFMSGSLEPPLCLVSVAKRAHMHEHLPKAAAFSVNILAAGQEHLASHFAGRPVPFFQPSFDRHGDVPILLGTVASIVAEIAAAHDCGDHTLYVGHIEWMRAEDRTPLLYHASRFAGLVKLNEASPSVPEFW